MTKASVTPSSSLMLPGIKIVGTPRDDVLLGTDGDDVVLGLRGNDTVYGGEGNDTLYGGDDTGTSYSPDKDTLFGGAGDDALFGGADDDALFGGTGNDALYGGTGNDTLDGGNDLGDDKMYGGDGDDAIIGGSGLDLVDGGLGFDTVDYSRLSASVTLRPQGVVTKTAFDNGGPVLVGTNPVPPPLPEGGQDQLVGIERIVGPAGQQNVIDARVDAQQPQVTSLVAELNAGFLTVRGIPGLPDLTFQVENFTDVIGTRNADTLLGDDRANALSGEGGNDVIDGNAGDDLIDGGAGDDTLNGGAGDDRVSGGDGTDYMAGGGGNDIFDGGTGYDTVALNDATASVYIDLRLTGSQSTGGAGTDTFVNVENLIGSNFGDVLIGGATGSYLSGLEGNDTLQATSTGVNYLEGGKDNDTLIGGVGLNDTALYYQTGSGVQINLAKAGPQNAGVDGLDVLINVENVVGSGFADFLTGNDSANRLEGRGGGDTLDGGGGNDRLEGGLGSDTLTGGQEADQFVFAPDSAKDVVTDFMPGIDKLIFNEFRFYQTPACVFATAVQVGNDVSFELSTMAGSTFVVLQDTKLSSLHMTDILTNT